MTKTEYVDYLISEETKAIDDYKKSIKLFGNDAKLKFISKFALGEEEHHLAMLTLYKALSSVQEGENGRK